MALDCEAVTQVWSISLHKSYLIKCSVKVFIIILTCWQHYFAYVFQETQSTLFLTICHWARLYKHLSLLFHMMNSCEIIKILGQAVLNVSWSTSMEVSITYLAFFPLFRNTDFSIHKNIKCLLFHLTAFTGQETFFKKDYVLVIL